ncbi:MAG: endolytic transglycosylase MltG [Patescibacteria group bacterium]
MPHSFRYKKNKFTKLLVLPLLVIIVLLLGYIKYNSNVYSPVDPDDNTSISFQIKKGQTIKEIAKNLKEKNLIKSPSAFYWYAKFNNLGQDVIAGRFILNKTMNTPKILKAISDPAQAEFIITIQEGLAIKDVDQKLVDLDLINNGEFIQAVKNFNKWELYPFLDKTILEKLDLPLEGYIYPDTYFLDPENFKPEDLIYLTLDNFEKKFSELQKQLKKHTVHQIITMASIIENEVRGMTDRKLVSGILWKRLESDWPLGADATLLYITDDRKIDSKDLKIDSLYNTRKNKGLPPGPIGNPSIESIEAAMYPTENDYWFYLTTLDTGEVIYSKTNEEHNVNRAKYL